MKQYRILRLDICRISSFGFLSSMAEHLRHISIKALRL
jgi:hypothetical protein